MARSVIITCAVTGGGDTVGKSKAVPVTPEQIATSAIDAAKAGAAIVHLHVRDPQTGRGSTDPALFRETVRRIRDSGTDVILNLTTGHGAIIRLTREARTGASIGGAVLPPEERVAHVEELRPEICSLDMGTMNFGANIFVNTPEDIAAIARGAVRAGSRPELEVFDLGQIRLAQHLIDKGEIAHPALFQLCLGVPWGAPATAETMAHMRNMLPPGSPWCAFGIASQQFPMVAHAVLLGGHVRVGLEDNLYLDRGILAPSNAALVERAVSIVTALGAKIASPAEARTLLGLRDSIASLASGAAAE
jgi:uncharacterized protein (DUF849 family)